MEKEELEHLVVHYVGRGELQREWNNLDTASRYLQEGIAHCQHTGNAVIMLLGYIARARKLNIV